MRGGVEEGTFHERNNPRGRKGDRGAPSYLYSTTLPSATNGLLLPWCKTGNSTATSYTVGLYGCSITLCGPDVWMTSVASHVLVFRFLRKTPAEVGATKYCG